LKLYKKHQYLVKYVVIGVTGATIDFLIFIFLTRSVKFNYQIANVFSVSFGITNNFILNYFFNFKVRGDFMKRLISFYSIGLFGLLLNGILLFVAVNFFYAPQTIAKLFALVVVVSIQFLLNKKITFKYKT
jgi:putative flippase GtrA